MSTTKQDNRKTNAVDSVHTSVELSAEIKQKIDRELEKFPSDQSASAIIGALRFVQEAHGWVSEPMMAAVADYLKQPLIKVCEVATFYSLFAHSPQGRHTIYCCTNISCMLRGSDEIMGHLKKRLGVEVGETTSDGRFTLKEVECLGACIGAPMLQLDKQYYENLTPERVDALLDELE